MSACSRCQGINDRLPQRYCRACHAAYARDNRKRYAELPGKAKARNRARAYLNTYIARGKVPRGTACEQCDAPVPEAHHDDYNKPLEVRWLCRPCHIQHHKKEAT